MKLLYGTQRYKTKTITINKSRYSAILADSPVKRAIGLMFRESLPEKSCMLFIFSYPGHHSIWMRNMRFPIDAVWLDDDGAILEMRENLKPCSSAFNCPQYGPKRRASYLIEFNAGAARKKKMKVGSKVLL
jgi:uncharacterized protein